MQRGNLEMRSVGTTRPLRGVALFDETCELTDEDAQEATVRACVAVWIREESSLASLEQHRRATSNFARRCVHGNTSEVPLYILILADSKGALSEEEFLALEPVHWSEGSAWLGWDLRQVGIGAMLDSNMSAMSRARVWTNSFTMAEHIQQEAIAREGPLHSEELFHLLKNCDTR